MDHRLVSKHDRIARELKEFRTEVQTPDRRLPAQVSRVLDFIHRHLFDPQLNAGLVKARCGIRNHNISTRFKVLMGTGIREYIEQLRLQAADRLLRRREIEVYLVALAVGYDHPETFSRAFRRYFGCPPSARRSRRAEE